MCSIALGTCCDLVRPKLPQAGLSCCNAGMLHKSSRRQHAAVTLAVFHLVCLLLRLRCPHILSLNLPPLLLRAHRASCLLPCPPVASSPLHPPTNRQPPNLATTPLFWPPRGQVPAALGLHAVCFYRWTSALHANSRCLLRIHVSLCLLVVSRCGPHRA